jgi:hypothetical protein
MNWKERFAAWRTLALMLLLLLLVASCAWTPLPQHYCPIIITQEEYDRFRALLTIQVLPLKKFNEVCRSTSADGCSRSPMAFTVPWVTREGRVVAAEVYFPDRLQPSYYEDTLFHEICHLVEIDSGVPAEDSARHIGWIDPDGPYRPESLTVIAELP